MIRLYNHKYLQKIKIYKHQKIVVQIKIIKYLEIVKYFKINNNNYNKKMIPIIKIYYKILYQCVIKIYTIQMKFFFIKKIFKKLKYKIKNFIKIWIITKKKMKIQKIVKVFINQFCKIKIAN